MAIYILLPLKSSAHDTCIPPHPFSLFLVIYFDLPQRFESTGVYGISLVSDRGQPHKHKNLAIMKIGAFCPWLWKQSVF